MKYLECIVGVETLITPRGERFMDMSNSSGMYQDIFILQRLANSTLYSYVVLCKESLLARQ